MIRTENKILSIFIFLGLLYLSVKRSGGVLGIFNLLDVLVTLFIYIIIFNVGIVAVKNIQKNINR
jgi:hypothetical protein